MHGLNGDILVWNPVSIVSGDLPLSIGGGIGQSRTFMLLLRKALVGEVSVTEWPKILKEMCAKRNIPILE
jgi:aspartate--ammonia ligase